MSASSLWQRGSIAVVVSTVLLVSACGGGSSSGAAAAAGTSGPAAAGATTGAKVAPGPTAAGVTSVKATGGGDFCKNLAAAVNTTAATSGASTPAEVKKQFQANEQNALKALSKAPSAIKADVQVIVDATTKLLAALEKVNYDFTKITPADEAALDTPAFSAASAKVATYVKTKCGFDIGAAASSS